MDFNVGLLLFLFLFFVLPLIQRVLGGAKKAPPGSRPGQRRPGVPPGRSEDRAQLPDDSRSATPGHADAGEPDRAADLVPDDLWEILTGERRTRTPEPELEAEAEWGTDAEEAWQPEEPAGWVPEPDAEDPNQEAPSSWRREHEEPAPITRTRAPAATSASEIASPPAMTQPSPYANTDAVTPGSADARPYALEPRRRRALPSVSNRSDLKRAFVLREVLGPPKALE